MEDSVAKTQLGYIPSSCQWAAFRFLVVKISGALRSYHVPWLWQGLRASLSHPLLVTDKVSLLLSYIFIYHCDSQKPVGQTPYTNQSKLVSDPGIGSACCKKAKPKPAKSLLKWRARPQDCFIHLTWRLTQRALVFYPLDCPFNIACMEKHH